MEGKGKPIDQWTFREVREIVEGLRYVHNLSPEEFNDNEVMEMFSYEDLSTLYQYYVAWKDDHKKELNKRIDCQFKPSR